jgi:hypothetical protein
MEGPLGAVWRDDAFATGDDPQMRGRSMLEDPSKNRCLAIVHPQQTANNGT